MVYQSNSNAVVSYKVQSGLGTQSSGSGGTVLRTSGGAGIKLSKAATESNEVRADGMRSRGRHGTQKTVSDYAAELTLGSHDPIIEAIMRGTWSSTPLSATSADFTTVTTTTSTIVAAGGSWITKGFKVGDVIRGASFPDAGNNSKNIRITGLTALVITTSDTLVLNATPSGAPTISRPGKRLLNPPAASLVRRYFTLDEYEVDIDQSSVLTDFRWGSIKFAMAPNGLITADPGGMGTGQIAGQSTATSPLLTSPTATTGAPMAVVDATIRVGTQDMVALTSLDLTMDIGLSSPDVFGSGAIKYGPDVFDGQMAISINMGMLRSDLTKLQDFISETPYSLHILAVEQESEPKDFMSIYVPNFTLGTADPSALSKQGGGRTQTISVPAALSGIDPTGGAFDSTMVRFQTSAP